MSGFYAIIFVICEIEKRKSKHESSLYTLKQMKGKILWNIPGMTFNSIS